MRREKTLAKVVASALSLAMIAGCSSPASGSSSTSDTPEDASGSTAQTAVEDGYIAAPYTAADEAALTAQILDPVFYENEDGPTIGVTLLGVIAQDGKYFRDLDNDQELDDFEDWRLDAETRAKAMAAALTDEQLTHQVANNGAYSPKSTAAADVVDENGDPVWTLLYPATGGFGAGGGEEDPDATNIDMLNNDGFRTFVLRSNPETEVAVWFNNGLEQYSEYDAITNG